MEFLVTVILNTPVIYALKSSYWNLLGVAVQGRNGPRNGADGFVA